MDSFSIKLPEASFVDQFLIDSLQKAPSYKIDSPKNITVKLDQNEIPVDWPESIKKKVLQRVQAHAWQRYPTPFTPEINEALSQSLGVPAECILTTNGSNLLLSFLLTTLSKKLSGDLVLAKPSFAHYEMTCIYEGISYKTWNLDQDFNFDLKQLDALPEGSVVFFASPNNPVGNELKAKDLKTLLNQHQRSLFVADEAYFEFADESYLPLMQEHSNLILVRTFSKTMGAAGIRLGYMLAAPTWIQNIQKLRPPYLINFFGREAALEILQSPELKDFRDQLLKDLIQSRDHVIEQIQPHAPGHFRIIPPSANFFMMQWDHQDKCQAFYHHLVQKGVLVRDISRAPGLKGCLRVSIGSTEENAAFVQAARSFF